MANLETLELTINANAERATQGIGSLVRSLSALSTAVGKNIGGLMKLNEQLAQLKQYGRMKMPTAASMTSGGRGAAKGATSSARKDLRYIIPEFRKEYLAGKTIASWRYGPQPPVDIQNGLGFQKGYETDEERKAKNPQWYKTEEQMAAIVRQNEALRQQTTSATQAITEQNEATKEQMTTVTQAATANNELSSSEAGVASSADSSASSVANLGEATKETSSMFGRLKQAFHKAGETADKVGSRIGRLASTMIMRMAIKALIKNFTEAWSAAYNFSKKMGGSFAKSIDNIKGSFQSMSINIVRAFAPLIQVVAPIISVIASGIKYLTDAIIALLKVIGIASDLFGATASNIAAVGGASGGAAKDVLASFDELNVLDSSGGGGGGGGGGSNFLKDFTEQIETVKVIVGEALLAVGLILAFMGHPAIGIGLAAVGAAAIAGTIVTKWGSLSDEVKGEITKIMIVAGGAMLAIGAIIAFACPTKLGLGIALMAAGAANLVAGVTLSWGLSAEIRKEVGKITSIVGGALLAIGAILAFACPGTQGIGIAMMAAGGVSLVASVALNWDSLTKKVTDAFGNIRDKLVEIWKKVEEAVTGAWESVKEWASATWSKIGKGWANIKAKLSEVWEKVRIACVNAWAKVSNWINMTWDKIKEGWENIKNGLKGVWDTVSKAVSDAWTAVGDWISAKWEDISKGWESIKQGFSDIWTGIQSGFEAAWNVIKQLWEDPLGMLSKAWGGVVTWFRYNIVKPLQEALPGIFGEWKEPGEDETNPVTAFLLGRDKNAPLAEIIDQLTAVMGKNNVDTYVLGKIKEHMPKIKASDVIAITDWESLTDSSRNDLITALIGTYGREGLASVRSKFPQITASEILSITEWKKFGYDQKIQFLNAAKEAFGSEAVIKAAQAAGIDLAVEVGNGMKGSTDEIKQSAKWWASEINRVMNENSPSVSPKLNYTAVDNIVNDTKKPIENMKPTVTINKIEVPQDQKNNVINELGGLKPTINPNVNIPNDKLNDLRNQIQGVKPTVTTNVDVNKSGIRSSIIGALNNIKLSLTSNGTTKTIGDIIAKANGGFVDSGDIFIANENGVPEMVGTFGNRTAVANTDQIVAGIATGVAQANEEQNALLRQQNSLLRGILEKDASVRIGASAALGRVARQSLDMYSGLVGVR